MNEEGEALGSFTLCIDQVFIKRDSFACREQPQSVSIVIDSREKHFESEIIDIELNTPRSLDIRHDLPYANGTQTRVDIRVFIDDIIVAHFEFSFSGNELRSYQQFEDDLFVRLIIRAFVPDPFSFKFKIFSLREFSIRDIDRESIGDIGRGSFGCVYSAEMNGVKEPVALKCLAVPDIRDRRDSSIREILPFITIPHHPCIVGIYGYIFNSNQFILVLEYVETGSFVDLFWIKKIQISTFQRQKLIYSMIHCLGHMQSYGLIHRDLSPFNILVTSDYESKIIDFSISRFYDEYELTEFQGNVLFMAPEVKRHEHYGKEADSYVASQLLFDVLYPFKKIKVLEERWELFILIPFFNYFIECKDSRLDFNDMCLLLESIFNDNSMIEYIQGMKRATNYECYSISLDKIFSFSLLLLSGYQTNGFLLLELASELLKVGINDPDEEEPFDLIFNHLMMVGCVAFDLEMVEPVVFFDNKYEYDRNRMIYRTNMSLLKYSGKSYKECFLEFDEQVGFRPNKFSLINKGTAIDLALLYHSMKIVRIENESDNPRLEQIISILNDYTINEADKHDKCTDILLDYQHLWYIEVLQALYGALADVGYVKMAVYAWKLYKKHSYGWKMTVKYLQMAIDNGDQESIEYLRSHPYLENEESFENKFHIKQTKKKIKANDIPSALYSLLNYLSKSIKEEIYKFKELKNYHLTLGLIYIILKEHEEGKMYIEEAVREGSSSAKEFLDCIYSSDISGIFKITSHDFKASLDIAQMLADLIRKYYGDECET